MPEFINLVPIRELKIDKTKWLNTNIKYESSLKIEDLLNDMCENILRWLYNLEDYTIITDERSFNEEFKDMIYEKYLYNSKSEIDTESYDYNYFELKYLEEINSLYLEYKRILEYYGLDFFKNKDFMELFYFIYEYTQYLEGEEELSDSEEEDYLNYNIDAEKIK